LIETFCDEVCREALVELLVLHTEGIMRLGERHSTRLEPAVKDFRNTLERTFAHFRGDCNLVDVLTMKVLDTFNSREFFKLGDRFNADSFLAIIRNPNGDGVAPVAVAREAPVLGIDKPIVKTFFLDRLRNPVSFVVFLDKLFFDISDLNKPAVKGTVDQWSLTSPAEGITMAHSALV